MSIAVGKRCLLATVFLILVTRSAESGVGRYLIQFREHLKIPSDLKLTGIRTSSSVEFSCESSRKPISGSTLHLFIDHSPAIDGNRSFLSVTLNYGILRSVRLDEQNQFTTEIVIPLPPEMLRSENEIVFSAEQFPAAGGSNEIWTSIKPSSFVSIEYEEDHPALDLRDLPSPFVDVHSYRPKQLSVLVPAQPSSQTLEGTALLIANYAARLGDALAVRPIRSMDVASGPLLIVGTPEEQPIGLLDHLPFRLIRAGKQIRLGESQGPFTAEDGIVALIEKPARNFTPILLVTGNSPAAVSRAIRKLIDGLNESGTFTRISEDVPSIPEQRRHWKGFLPPENHFTLEQMGLKELKFDAQNNFSSSVPIRATPDTEFLAYGHQMKLAFRFNSEAVIEHAGLDVDWNGYNLGRLAAADFTTGSRMSFQLKIPGHLLRRQNVLSMTWHGLADGTGKDPAVWLLATTEFDLPRDYRSSLPDLGLLRAGLFPFGLRSDLSDAVIVLPEESSPDVAAGLFEFAGLLGRLIPADQFSFRVKRQNELSREERISTQMIAFRIAELSKAARSKRAVASIEERASPFNAEKYVLTITSSSPAGLRASIGTIFSEAVLGRLSGDTAYIAAEGPLSFKTTRVRQISEVSYFNHLQAWLRENWIALPLILVTISCLLFVGLRLVLVQYKNRNRLHRHQAFGLTSSSGPRNPL
jgi:hypothetical protein